MSPAGRKLILHADDFGMSRQVTDGILQGFTHGLLTSTAILANAPDASRAVELWKRLLHEPMESHAAAARRASIESLVGGRPLPFDLGVHFNLTQGRPLSGAGYPEQLLDRDGRFPGIGRLFLALLRPRSCWKLAVAAELSAQMESVLDFGVAPTHANGHQYIEMIPFISEIFCNLLPKYGIRVVRVPRECQWWRTTIFRGASPMRCALAAVKRGFATRFARRVAGNQLEHAAAFFGASHAGEVGLDVLQAFLSAGRSASLVEIALHPGWSVAANDESTRDGWEDPIAVRRPDELALLTRPDLAERLGNHGYRLGRLASLTGA